MSGHANALQSGQAQPLHRIDLKEAAGVDLFPSPVMWRIRVAETGRVFEIPVFERTGYHEFLNILMVLPGAPNSPHDTMYLAGPSPYRLLTSKKFTSIVQSGECGQVFLFNVSQQRLELSPIADPANRSNKTPEYTLSSSVKLVDRARQHMLEQEVQMSAINTLLVYAKGSLDSFYESFFGPVKEKLTAYDEQIKQFDELMLVLAETPLHPALAALASEGLGSGGSAGGVSKGSTGSGNSSPVGSRSSTPRVPGGDAAGDITILDTPGGAVSVRAVTQPSSSVQDVSARKQKETLLDCISADSWRLKRSLFAASCKEIEQRLESLLAEYDSIKQTVPTPFILHNVHMNVAALYRITSLLRIISKQPTALNNRNSAPSGVEYAGLSPMAMGGPELSASQALREILKQAEKKTTEKTALSSISVEDTISGSVESPASLSASAIVRGLLFETTPSVSSTTNEVGSSVDSDPKDAISIYVAMEKTLQQQIYDAEILGIFQGDVAGGPIFLKDVAYGSNGTDVLTDIAESATDAQKEAHTKALSAVADKLLRRRYRLDQMAKALDFFKERISDEVVRVSRIVRNLKVSLKRIEKSDAIKFLKLWKDGKNEHSATLAFLQNYPAAYSSFLSEITRIRGFNHLLKDKLDELKHIQNNELKLRKAFWESSLRFLPPIFLDIVPSVRRPPLMLIGPGGVPGIDELFSSLPEVETPHASEACEACEACENVVAAGDDNTNSSPTDALVPSSEDSDMDPKSAVQIKALENQLAEKEKEIEALKMSMKNNVKYENDLRDLRYHVNPFAAATLREYLIAKMNDNDSISVPVAASLDKDQAHDEIAVEYTDTPRIEEICLKILDGMEMEEHARLTYLHNLLSSNAYFKNYQEDSHHSETDINSLRTLCAESLEATLEQFAKIVQHQSRIIGVNK